MNEAEVSSAAKDTAKTSTNQVTHEVAQMKISQDTPPPLEGKALTDAIKKQIEFYFSRQNLQNDGFLVSKMNANMEVPISVIAEFAKVRALTKDPQLIVEAMKDSQVCIVTQEAIKPNFKTERNTIILREIPSETPADKVKEIFKGEGFAPITHIRSDVGDTWFVTMATEAEAVSSVLALRDKQFDGKPIKARLKSENILRSFYPVPTATDAPLPAPAQFPMAPQPLGVPPFMQPMMMLNGRPTYFGMPPNAQQQAAAAAAVQRGMFRRNEMMGGGMNQFGMRMGGGGLVSGPRTQQAAGPRNQNQHQQGGAIYIREPRRARGDSHDGSDLPAGPTLPPPQHLGGGDHSRPMRDRESGGDHRGKGRSDRNKPKGGRDHRRQSPRLPPQADFTASDFPALPGQGGPAAKRKPVPKPGYQGDYRKYDPEEILQIVSSLSIEDIILPEGIDLDEHSVAMLKEPNLGLLRNQRTISIDETREVLKQGKPLIRDSVMHGEVDYESLKFGDQRSNNNRRRSDSENQYRHHNHSHGHGHAHGHSHGGKKPHHPHPKKDNAKRDKDKDNPPPAQVDAATASGDSKKPKEDLANGPIEEEGGEQKQGAYAAAVMKGGSGNKSSAQARRRNPPNKKGGGQGGPRKEGGKKDAAEKGNKGGQRKGGGGQGKAKKDGVKGSSQKKAEGTEEAGGPAPTSVGPGSGEMPTSSAPGPGERGGGKKGGASKGKGGQKKWGSKKTFVEVLAGGNEADSSAPAAESSQEARPEANHSPTAGAASMTSDGGGAPPGEAT
mmetsp:Transcript_12796/g.16686  ORF Transcript_12796/g.16686 Transcript_12796/m.16686 type:complete len:781 (-) Transcript_12796:478-2820(-)